MVFEQKLKLLARFHLFQDAVKIQFFKSFIIPYFDYCMSLSIYFNKQSIQKICNKYYFCLYKLFNIDASTYESLNDLNNHLKIRFKLSTLQHRIFKRFSFLIFKYLNFNYGPVLLKKILVENFLSLSLNNMIPSLDNIKVLRSKVILLNLETKLTKHSQNTFAHVSNLLIKSIGLESFDLDFNLFKSKLNTNLLEFYNNFLDMFNKFNIVYKNFSWSLNL